jgi:hypothetical protein
VKDFRKYEVWQKAHQLTLEVYKATGSYLLLAHDIGLLTDTIYEPLDAEVNRVKRMLNALMQKVKLSDQPPARKSQKPTAKSQEPK